MKAHIKISFRQIIDTTCNGSFEKNILRASYNEFVLKSQAYNQENKFKTFQQLVQNDGRANSLHYKSGFAVVQFIKALNNKMPCLQDSLGRSIVFSSHKFEILNSDLSDPSQHIVAITYITGTLTLYGNMGDYLLLANDDYLHSSDKPVDTFVLKMQEGLTICSYLEIPKENDLLNFQTVAEQNKNHL